MSSFFSSFAKSSKVSKAIFRLLNIVKAVLSQKWYNPDLKNIGKQLMIENKIKTQKFIVKYFTEIMIKGDRKRQMLSQLLMNLQKISKDISNEIVLKSF